MVAVRWRAAPEAPGLPFAVRAGRVLRGLGGACGGVGVSPRRVPPSHGVPPGVPYKGMPGGGGARPPTPPPPPRHGTHMRAHDRCRPVQSRSAKQKSKRKALQ